MQAWNAPWARQDVDAQLQRVERRMQRIFRAADTLADGQTLVYGWTVAAGPDGEPHVSEFGNIDLSRRGLEQGWRSPNVRYRTDPEARTLHLEFDLPGVPRDAIQLAVAEDEIHVSAASGDRRYRSTIPLTGTVDPDSADATYRDGVLELEIRAEAAPERHRRDVRVR
jgi:HSP20 family protein